MTKRDDRTLKNMVLKDRRATSGELAAELAHHGVLVSPQTVRERLVKMGYVARRPKKKPLLTTRNDEGEVGLGKETSRMDCGGLEECNLV